MHPTGKISSAETATNLRPADADDSKTIEHFVDGLADRMPFAGASRASCTIGCRKSASHMTKAERRGMTSAQAPVEQFADR